MSCHLFMPVHIPNTDDDDEFAHKKAVMRVDDPCPKQTQKAMRIANENCCRCSMAQATPRSTAKSISGNLDFYSRNINRKKFHRAANIFMSKISCRKSSAVVLMRAKRIDYSDAMNYAECRAKVSGDDGTCGESHLRGKEKGSRSFFFI